MLIPLLIMPYYSSLTVHLNSHSKITSRCISQLHPFHRFRRWPTAFAGPGFNLKKSLRVIGTEQIPLCPEAYGGLKFSLPWRPRLP